MKRWVLVAIVVAFSLLASGSAPRRRRLLRKQFRQSRRLLWPGTATFWISIA